MRPVYRAFVIVRKQSRFQLAVVASATSSKDSPFTSATLRAVSTTNAGSLRFPLHGTGARYGASVSTSKRSSGVRRTAARSSSAFGKVMIPE